MTLTATHIIGVPAEANIPFGRNRPASRNLVFIFRWIERRTKKITAVKKMPDSCFCSLNFFELAPKVAQTAKNFRALAPALVQTVFSSRPEGAILQFRGGLFTGPPEGSVTYPNKLQPYV